MTFWENDKTKKPGRGDFDPGQVAPGWDWFWDGIAGVFLMQEGVGATFFDTSFNRYSASFSGSPVWSTGPGGREIDFSPTDAFAKTAVGSTLATRFQSKTRIGLTLYARASSYAGQANAGLTIKQESDVSGSDSIVFYPYDNRDGNGARVFMNSTQLVNENTGALADNKNHLFTFSMFKLGDNRIFVEGVEVVTSGFNRTISANTDVVNIAGWDGAASQSYHGQTSYAVVHTIPPILAQHAQLAHDPFGPFRMKEDVGWLAVAAVGGANPHGPLGHPLHGPFGGPL